MESLLPVILSGDDVAVGVSGFGSARPSLSRWTDLALLTSRSTFVLSYDAQELPGEVSATTLLSGAPDLYRKWHMARKGALQAADHLAVWIRRWTLSGRRVLLVGFSLGAYVVWEAVKKSDRSCWPLLDVVLVSGALVDSPIQWEGADLLGSLTNVYSSSDLVLKWLYPGGVGSDETPAAGLGPIMSEAPGVSSIDLTDLIGADHMWAGNNLPTILRTVLGVGWSSRPTTFMDIPDGPLGSDQISRLSAWLFCLPDLWEYFGRALDGDAEAIRKVRAVDHWSVQADRLLSLVDAGQSVARLRQSSAPCCGDVASRSAAKIEGLIRRWLEE
jgi:hypothetical protein